jgi:hypothetical protein
MGSPFLYRFVKPPPAVRKKGPFFGKILNTNNIIKMTGDCNAAPEEDFRQNIKNYNRRGFEEVGGALFALPRRR